MDQNDIKWKYGKLLGAYMERNNHKRGFTLVELIVVLVILAVLAALLVPSLTGYIDKAKKASCDNGGKRCVDSIAGCPVGVLCPVPGEFYCQLCKQ
ncbi:type II secretion system protein [Gemmiger formicilis]|uniref:type II secretion system protein n=1 Tax=Gemmiger formicilis TaxID=745368 RepID=UPI00399A6EC3